MRKGFHEIDELYNLLVVNKQNLKESNVAETQAESKPKKKEQRSKKN